MTKKCDLINGIKPLAGNSVSHSNRRTRRVFIPNLHTMKFHSDILGVDLKLKVASKTLRTINKYGNIDNFLINYGYNKLSEKGRILRRKLLKSRKIEAIK